MRFVTGLMILVCVGGCEQKPASETDAKQQETTSKSCADKSLRLDVTGLCQSDANALVGHNPELRTPELENCTWSVKEVQMPGDEVILYRAARCQDKDTVLSFAGGARRAELSYESSAVYGEAAQGRVVVALYGTEPDPQGALKMAINELPAKERGTCRIVPAEREGWPSDALLIAPESKNQPDTGGAYVPLVACGPLGVNGKKYSYWRIRQGFAWFIDLGEKDPDLDAGNMVIVTKTEGGAWRPKP